MCVLKERELPFTFFSVWIMTLKLKGLTSDPNASSSENTTGRLMDRKRPTLLIAQPGIRMFNYLEENV